jgi:hypothetical protein
MSPGAQTSNNKMRRWSELVFFIKLTYKNKVDWDRDKIELFRNYSKIEARSSYKKIDSETHLNSKSQLTIFSSNLNIWKFKISKKTREILDYYTR